MGNSSSKHAEGGPSGRPGASEDPNTANLQQPSSRSRARASRGDFNLITGFTPPRAAASQHTSQPEQRRETRQEREARRLERERVAREKERERSMREEHVDGGFLVTMGIYKGREDFSKPIVRQLQIERKLAPFWRPLEVDPDDLTDAQLVYAARGLPVPEPDASLPSDILAAMQSPTSPNQSTSNLNLAVPTAAHAGQGQTAGSEAASSNPGSTVASPTVTSHPRKSRGKAIAEALSLRSSRNNSSTDLSQREFSLPNEPLVDNQPLEVVLYRPSEDCPICFATYPNHLNYTRCCGNAICSECFVQIKRPDPHIPEGHGEPGAEGPNPNPNLNPNPNSTPNTNSVPTPAPAITDQASRETHSMLVSEPAACPYCTQPEFGVTYEPPPFRRGLVYATPALLGSSAMSSQTSLHSSTTPGSPASPAPATRRRGHSLSANAPNVVTTDRIRPDWALKLASLRTTQARRAAAATALHQAAFIMYSPDRQFSLGPRAPRFMRRNTSSSNGGARDEQPRPDAPSSGNAEGDRLQQFEEVMMAEAIRLSLAAEEERRRKAEREAEKEAKKEAKKREKEERKQAKAQKKAGSVYGDGAASRSRSSVSLALGRRRGNSSGTLQVGPTPEVPKEESESGSGNGSGGPGGAPAEQSPQSDKGKGVDRGTSQDTAGPSSSMAIPQRATHGPSHLRQTSNISSLSSSLADSPMGSYAAAYGDASQGAGGASLGGDAATGPESLFNFASMASTLGIDLSRQNTDESARADNSGRDAPAEDALQGSSQETTQVPEEVAGDGAAVPKGNGDGDDKKVVTPEVRLMPGTPMVSDEEFSKGFEHESSAGQRGGEVA